MTGRQLNRILYVEDEPDIRQVAQLALEVVGHFTLKVCSSGEEALQALPRFKPDLILLDVMMPGMDGPTTLRKLRELPESSGVPAIFMTAKVQPQEVVELKRIGALDVIAKPFDPMTLARTVREIWSSDGPPGDAPRQRDAARTQQEEISSRGQPDSTPEAQTLQQMAGQFAAKLPDRLAEIVSLWQALSLGSSNASLSKALHRKVHSLTGSATTFGFAPVSEAARRLELQLKPFASSEQAPDPSQLASVASFVEALQRSASCAPTPMPEMAAVTLPATEPAAAAAEHNRLIYVFGREGQAPGGLREQLQGYGYDARGFGAPDDLMQACIRALPAAILADVDVEPDDLAGVMAAVRLRETLREPPPVIFISDRDDLVTRLRAVRAGSVAFYQRPLKVSALVDKLDELGARVTPEPFRVMIVEDDEDQSMFYSAVLRQAGMLTSVVNDPRTLLEHLGEFHPELVLMDMYLPDCSGDELSRLIRQIEEFVGMPIVFLSVESDFDRQLSAMGRGGDEFLTKPILPAQLLSVVKSRVERYRTLRALMVQDSLTGLANHSRLQQLLETEVARALRHDLLLALAMIDIDHFKEVNDRHGHPTGDRVLRALGRFLRQRLRQGDVIGRYGGEEFAVVMPCTEESDATMIMDRLRAQFAALVHESDRGGSLSVTFSAGIAALSGLRSARELLLAADRALYAAKDRGRNCVVANSRVA